MSNTCVIRRLAFLNLGFIDLLSCTRSLPPSTTSIQRILVCPRTSTWDCSERSWGFHNDCSAVRRLGNRGCFKKSMKNELDNGSSNEQSESVHVRPKRMASTRLATYDPRTCPGPDSTRWRVIRVGLSRNIPPSIIHFPTENVTGVTFGVTFVTFYGI